MLFFGTDPFPPTVWVTEYDPVDQLLGVTVRSNTVAGAILKQFVYGYDKAGNRTSEQIQSSASVPPAISTASHNNLNQLTGVAGGGPVRFAGTLNELGTVTVAGNNAAVDSRNTNFTGYAAINNGTNLVSVVATDYSGNSRTNNYQIVVTNNGAAKTLNYDLNGNLVSSISATATNTYEWDAVNRLVAINGGTNRTELFYDGLGRRTQIIERQNGASVSTNRFLWCGTELCEERDATGASTTKRFFGQGVQISGTNYFLARDHLGSVREMTDSAGTIRARYDYDPYGRRMKVSGDLDSDFGFTGHYYHEISALHLAPFRAYDAETGKWISRDPIQEEGGLNLYAYVGHDPINAVDLFGLSQGDAFRMVAIMNNFVHGLNRDGLRSDVANDLRRSLGGKQLGCGEQASALIGKLMKQKFEDDWKVILVQEQQGIFPHQYLILFPVKPGDPHVLLDPFDGTYKISYKLPTRGGGIWRINESHDLKKPAK